MFDITSFNDGDKRLLNLFHSGKKWWLVNVYIELSVCEMSKREM